MKRSDFIWQKKLKHNAFANELSRYKFDGPLEEVVLMLNEQGRIYTEKGFSDLHLDWVWEDEFVYVTLRGNVMETDEEFNSRIESQEEMLQNYKEEKKKRKDKEYETYLKLKAKYEKAK